MTRGKLPQKVLRRDGLAVPLKLPKKTRCIKVTIPDDLDYLNSFESILSLLGKWNSYRQDGAHQAADVAQLWRDVFAKYPIETCEDGSENIGVDEGIEQMIRQNPDNPCILESSLDGVTWCQWADLSLCLGANPPQPGPGGDGPEPGQTKQYCLTLDANGQAILPIAVQGDWTIELVQKQGGWTDGGGNWYCPNGQSYTLGLCTGVGGFNGADPLPTALHMSIVAEINSLFYDGNGVIAVPSGLTDQQVTFRANDASPSDNSGTVQFCVKVTATAASPAILAYVFGTGPAAVVPGQVITINSTHNGVGVGSERIDVQFSPCCTVSILASSGWVTAGSTGSPGYDDCSHVNHNHAGADVAPEALAAHTDMTELYLNSLNGSPFSIQVRIEAFA